MQQQSRPGGSGDPAHPPLCPITQEPAVRLVQWVSARLLVGLWKHSFKVDVASALLPFGRFGLWESPTGLMFFDPPVAGDAAFYRDFYRVLDAHEKLTGPKTVRREFQMAAERIRPGDAVLDVGCGLGGFRSYVPQAAYTGLDPHFGSVDGSGPVVSDTLDQHASRRPAFYDAACAFQVMEHVPDPLDFARQVTTCLKPGGRLILGVPYWPSPSTTIPNFMINAPPHHLAWWTEGALLALADRLGLHTPTVTPVPISRHEAIMYWMSKATPIRCGRDLFFAGRKSWYAALAVAYGLGRAMEVLLPVPRDARPNALLLVAHKPD